MVRRLFLYLREFKRSAAEGIARIWHIDPKDQRPFTTLEDLAKEIHKQNELEELIIFVHGYSGGILVDGTAYDLDDERIKQAFPKNKDASNKDAAFPKDLKTYVKNVRFEGCWVGEGPTRMATFGKLFDAQTVSAFNWTCNTNDVTTTIPRGHTTRDLAGYLGRFERWIMPASPTLPILASMARSRAVKVTLPLMWYRYGLEDDPDKAPYVGDNYARMRHTYAARSDATKREVPADKAVNNSSPAPPFEYVTVRLRGGNLRDV